ncbi:hypothetical protein D3C81_1775400 [compost metagenome]
MSERCFNQARSLAFGAATVCKSPVLEILRRSHTEKQSFKSRRERMESMMGIYAPSADALQSLDTLMLKKKKRGSDGSIRLLIVDDVYTTGSTIDACAATLQMLCRSIGSEPEIYSLTWARS